MSPWHLSCSLPESLVTLGIPRSPSGVAAADLSPTSALARLSFDRSPAKRASYEVVRSQSCHLGWLGSGRQASVAPTADAFPVVLRRKASGRRDPNAHDSAYRYAPCTHIFLPLFEPFLWEQASTHLPDCSMLGHGESVSNRVWLSC